MADNFYSSLQGIPIDYLVSAPLMAASRSNIALAQGMEEFVFTVGYQDGDPTKEVNLITFQLERPYTDNNTSEVKTQQITVSCPLLGLIPIPALLVDSVTVDFTTTIGNTSQDTTNKTKTVGGSYGFGAFRVSGSL